MTDGIVTPHHRRIADGTVIPARGTIIPHHRRITANTIRARIIDN